MQVKTKYIAKLYKYGYINQNLDVATKQEICGSESIHWVNIQTQIDDIKFIMEKLMIIHKDIVAFTISVGTISDNQLVYDSRPDLRTINN